MIEPEVQKKIALFANVEEKAVFCSPTIKCIYQLTLIFDNQGMGDYICERMGLPKKNPEWNSWNKVLQGYLHPKHEVKIALCGKYAKLADSYISINEAL